MLRPPKHREGERFMVSFKQRSGNSFYTFTLVLATALTILFTVGTSTAEAQSGRFAMVFATGGLGDQSFNDSAFAGVQSARERFGVEFDWAEPTSVAEYEALLTRSARARQLRFDHLHRL